MFNCNTIFVGGLLLVSNFTVYYPSLFSQSHFSYVTMQVSRKDIAIRSHLYSLSTVQFSPVSLNESIQHLMTVGEHAICKKEGGKVVGVRWVGELCK